MVSIIKQEYATPITLEKKKGGLNHIPKLIKERIYATNKQN